MPSDVEKRTLAPQELLRIEREEEKTIKAREADRDAREQLHLEREADELGLENTTNGKIRRMSPKYIAAQIRRQEKEETQQRLINFFKNGAGAGDIVFAVNALADSVNELRAAFTPSARQNAVVMRGGSRIIFEDDIAVTQATQEAIEKDQAFLSSEFNAFKAIDMDAADYVPGTKMRAGRAFVGRLQQFDMARHPEQRNLFVASIEKVMGLESKNKVDGVECTGTVCAFGRAADFAGVTSRKLKVGITDAFPDGDPSEVKQTANEVVQVAKAAPSIAPSFHIS